MEAPRPDHRADGPFQRHQRFYPLVITCFCAVFYLPYFFTPTTNLLPTYQDESQWWLYTLFINQSFSRGFFPLWTPDLACGMPFLAWSHSAALYPANLIFGLFEFGRAFWMVQLFHHIVFALGIYWLCRRLSASPAAALLATLIAAAQFVNGPVATFLPNLRTGSWGPLWMLCFYSLLAECRLRWLLGFSLITFLMFLGGQVELIGLGWELLAVCSLAAGIIVGRREGFRALIRPAALFIIAFALSFLISQVQALPTLELTHFSIRGKGLSYEYFRIWSNWSNFGYWLPWLFTGVTSASLIAATGRARRSPQVAALLAGLLFCAALIQNLFGFMRLMHLVPVARGLLAHARIFSFAVVVVAALTALGFDAMMRPEARAKWLRITGIIGLLVTPPLLYLLIYHSDLIQMSEQSGAEMVASFISASIFALALTMPLYLGMAVVPERLAVKPGLEWGVLGTVAIMVLAVPVIWSMPRNPIDPFNVSPSYTRFFEEHRELYRTQVIYPWDRWERIHIPVQSGTLAGTRSADAFITVSLDRYTRLIGSYLPDTYVEKDGYIHGLLATKVLKDSTITEPQNRPLLDLLGIRYLVTEQANLRSPSRYFLAYPDSALARSPGVRLERIEEAEYSRNEAEIRGRASMPLQASEGDRLALGAAEGNFWLVVTMAEGATTSLVMTRRLEEAPLTGKSITHLWQVSAPLHTGGKTADLHFAVLPPEAGAVLIDPMIVNPTKHFRRLDEIPPDRPFNIFKNPTALPAAFIPESVVELDKDEALRWVQANTEPGKRAVVEDSLPPPPGLKRPGEVVDILEYMPERVTMEVAAAQPRLAVLTDSIFPGWEMTVDGKPARIRVADYAFRGIPVPRGTSTVEMVYRPTSFRIGLWVTIASLTGVMLVALLTGDSHRLFHIGITINRLRKILK